MQSTNNTSVIAHPEEGSKTFDLVLPPSPGIDWRRVVDHQMIKLSFKRGGEVTIQIDEIHHHDGYNYTVTFEFVKTDRKVPLGKYWFEVHDTDGDHEPPIENDEYC